MIWTIYLKCCFSGHEYISRQCFDHGYVHQIPQANCLLNNDRPNCITELQIGLKHLKVSYLRLKPQENQQQHCIYTG